MKSKIVNNRKKHHCEVGDRLYRMSTLRVWGIPLRPRQNQGGVYCYKAGDRSGQKTGNGLG